MVLCYVYYSFRPVCTILLLRGRCTCYAILGVLRVSGLGCCDMCCSAGLGSFVLGWPIRTVLMHHAVALSWCARLPHAMGATLVKCALCSCLHHLRVPCDAPFYIDTMSEIFSTHCFYDSN